MKEGMKAKKYPPAKELRKLYDEVQKNFQLAPLLEQIMKFVVDTSNSKAPLMTKILVHLDGVGEDEPIVSLWASANLAASPLRRIEELLEENRRLKYELANRIKNSPVEFTTTVETRCQTPEVMEVSK
jgi:hypothetical protein